MTWFKIIKIVVINSYPWLVEVGGNTEKSDKKCQEFQSNMQVVSYIFKIDYE
jgi:hypothetical protein